MSESVPELSRSFQPAPVPPGPPGPALASNEATALIEDALGLVAADLAVVEREFAELLRSEITAIPEVGGHVAFAGGKRLRPLLTLLAAAATGLEGPERLTVAAVGELLHTATLLHDDVIDQGEFRRGRPAAHMHYGNGMAVLVGDYCLARALQAIAHTGCASAVRSLADMVTRMAEGEVAQLHGAGHFNLDRARYSMVIERKTAGLIGWCASVAGLVEPPFVEPLRRYGLAIGHAFQITDDVLDLQQATDSTPSTGKDPGQDLREGKMTLPIILACEADPILHQRVRTLLDAGPPADESTIDQLLERMAQTHAAQRALDIARLHVEDAEVVLQALPPSAARDALVGAAYYVIRRSR